MSEQSARRVSVYVVGRQPCEDFLRGDADIAALGDGNRRNCHQCPVCEGRRAWCDNCCADHHEHGWESCKLGAYTDADLDDDGDRHERSEWIGGGAPKATTT